MQFKFNLLCKSPAENSMGTTEALLMIKESLHLKSRLGLKLLKLHRDPHGGHRRSQDCGCYHDSTGVLQQKGHLITIYMKI